MWRLHSDHGRQWWTFSTSDAETNLDDPALAKEAALIEEARRTFHEHRFERKQAADQVYRIQALLRAQGVLSNAELSEEYAKAATLGELDATLWRGFCWYARLQQPDGHWPGDYGGPMFLLPGLLIVCYISRTALPEPYRVEMRRYLLNMQNPDGGWGLHIEAPSGMFGTVLNYVALRLLGMEASEEPLVSARRFIHEHGGAVMTPSWGKFWLACLGCYSWRGMNPLTPEMWLLPYGSGDPTGSTRPAIGWFANPIMPARYWCHCRVVYLPMSHIYGKRASGPETPLVLALREELYIEPYDQIDWPRYRHVCSSLDEYTHRPRVQKWLWDVLYVYEWSNNPLIRRLRDRWLRPRALQETLLQVRQEDYNTKWICIGPVNKAINMLVAWYDRTSSDAEAHFRAHQDRVKDYLWVAEDGMKMQGYNGSQLWDTAFAAQAYAESADLFLDTDSCLERVLLACWRYLEMSQVLEDVPEAARFYRHISKGAWPFSTRDHGWPISDCTAEGLRAVLAIRALFRERGKEALLEPPINDERIFDAVNVILSFQNPSGGWATYENTRSYPWLEYLNPSEVFSDIMIDWDHVECTSACVRTLIVFLKAYPNHPRTAEIATAIRRGVQFMKRIQLPDGSWYGNWGVCFTYGTWFAVEALVDAGERLDSCPALERACQFLEEHQHPSGLGGWGETFESCSKKRWHHSPEIQTVNTAWALMTLLAARWYQRGPEQRELVHRAARVLMSAQRTSDGSWDQQLIRGVFNRNCMITYNYETVFAIWALGRYRRALQTDLVA
ncbi:cycloartenol synthase [Cyanidioschyzon merolae strain 10D]|uniref:Terpene cyclase/mutase family member n=1 Tax=Cyanidioschyzon merolae (strain NIES-3377 / 10D) TaxID=280699 RepID=M1V571_CYAM1|nr:cycloartenol synthase [Cyanidioschyzon merolae strain 10D]BAM80160.1 cycloartenol synthase [Cyanidioschyzon merolae strain 10D]|eukprot:XP_005534767.1 cycloartenol synthase [Cyanidioschyzon merolae strain 10D]